jgi:hypothetical protein
MDALGKWHDVNVAGHERVLLMKWHSADEANAMITFTDICALCFSFSFVAGHLTLREGVFAVSLVCGSCREKILHVRCSSVLDRFQVSVSRLCACMRPRLRLLYRGDWRSGFTVFDVSEGLRRLATEFPHPFCGRDSIFYKLQQSGGVDEANTAALVKRLLYETGTSDE